MIEKLEQVFTNSEKNVYETIQEQLMGIDTSDLSDEVSEEILTDIIPGKVYFWTRIYLKDENPNIQIGDEITLKWTPSGEELKTQFITYGKKGLEKDHDDQVVNYNSEDDKKIICLMVEEKVINESNDIPFIRTLFKLGRHYENQLVRRDELVFINQKNGILLDYYDCDF